MKILEVLHGFPPETGGGTERAVEALARSMQAEGHDVTVLAGSLVAAPPGDVGREDLDGLPVLRMHRDDLYFESWFKAHAPDVSASFERVLADLRPDVVHVHHWIRLTSDLVRVARAAGAVVAVTMHDYFTVLATPVRSAGQDRPAAPPVPSYVSEGERAEAFSFHRRDFRAEIRAAHLRCAPSRSHADGLQALADGPLGGIAVTPPPMLHPPRPGGERAGPRGRRLATWGSWYPEKGLETVLEALRRSPGWSLEVWGEAHDPAYRARIEELAGDLPVAFRGAFDTGDLERLDADYAVLPSCCHESYGLTMDEALCLGLPVIASDIPSYRERAASNAVAYFAAGDAAGLAALLADEQRLAALVQPEPPAVRDAAASARHLLDLYGRAVRGEVPPAPAVEPITDRERAAVLFRRAERRLWTALQQNDPPAPPDSFP